MKTAYAEAFIEQALVKVFSRGQRTIKEIAAELHVDFYTLKYWMKRTSVPKKKTMPTNDKRPSDWPPAEKLTALQHALSGEALSMWCREKGLFAYHFTSLKDEFCASKTSLPVAQMRTLKDENDSLKKQILRKDKALAEAVALLVLHSDNGSPMNGASMLAMLNSLDVTASLSRPAVSNDNPFSESVFKTLKYRPDSPKKPFDNLTEARQWVQRFSQWYNNEHQHSAIGFVTPSQRHAGLDTTILQQRDEVYARAKAAKLQRWSGDTRNWKPVTIVYLNPDKSEEIGHVKVANQEQLKAA